MKILTEKDAEDFLEQQGFPIVKRKLVYNIENAKKQAAEIGFPVVLKNPHILHKTEKKAVILNVTAENLEQEFKNLNAKEVLIQKQISGQEVLVGLKKDPSFGHVLVFGLGGIYTEIMKDVSFRICPVTKKDIDEMIKEIKAYPLLTGARGLKPVNLNLIKDVLMKISDLTKKFPKISEFDSNPLMIEGNKAFIVDARIVFDD